MKTIPTFCTTQHMTLKYYQYQLDVSVIVKLNIPVDQSLLPHTSSHHNSAISIEIRKKNNDTIDYQLIADVSGLVTLISQQMNQSLDRITADCLQINGVEELWKEVNQLEYDHLAEK